MKLIRIKVDNFKSFKNFELELDENKNVIIGKNNSGKSAFLEIIKLMLNIFNKGKDNPAFDERFNDENLFNDKELPIEIEISFKLKKEELADIENFTNPISNTSVYKFDETKQNIIFDLKFSRKIGEEGIFHYEDSSSYNEYVKIATFIYFNSLVFDTNRTMRILEDDSIQKENSSITFKLILINLVMKFLSENKEPLDFDKFFNKFNEWFFNKDKTILEDFFPEIKEIVFASKTRFFDDLVQNINDKNLMDKAKEIVNFIIILVNDGKMQQLIHKGCGLQNLFLFNLILKANDFFRYPPLICIDEIELYLHPIAQKNLNLKLNKINNQFILTSHSEKFITNTDPEQIILFKKNSEKNITEKFTLSKDEEELYKLFKKIIRDENSEFLFSDFVILVEGLSDKVFFSHIIKLEETYNNSTVINMNSKNNVVNFIKIMNKFEIPYHIILDKDGEGLRSCIDEYNQYKDNVHILKKGELEDYYPRHVLGITEEIKVLKKFPDEFKFKLLVETIFENKHLLETDNINSFRKSISKIFNSNLNNEEINLVEKKYSEILTNHFKLTKYELGMQVCEKIEDNIVFDEELLKILESIKGKPKLKIPEEIENTL